MTGLPRSEAEAITWKLAAEKLAEENERLRSLLTEIAAIGDVRRDKDLWDRISQYTVTQQAEPCCSEERPHDDAPPSDGNAHWLRATTERRNP